MDKRHRNGYIFLGIFIIFVIVFYNIDMHRRSNQMKQLDKEYPRIVYEDSVEGIVNDIYHSKGYRVFPYFLRIEINNKKRSLGITPDSLTLTETLKVGSRIYKEANTYDFKIVNIENTDTIIYNLKVYKDASVFQSE